MTYTNLPIKLQALLDEFAEIKEKSERYQMLIYLADDFTEVPPSVATRPFPEQNKVPACESQAYVWVQSDENGKALLDFAVENPQGISAKAMAFILKDTLTGEPLESLLRVDENIVFDLYGKELSMGRSAGLTSMIALMKAQAKSILSN